ncbi:MAG: hypothetical protein WCS65_12750 [Verrucomicrobiae bacterium]
MSAPAASIESKVKLDNFPLVSLELGERAVDIVVASDLWALVREDIVERAACLVVVGDLRVEGLAVADLRCRPAEAPAWEVALGFVDRGRHDDFFEKKDPAADRSLCQVGDGLLDCHGSCGEEIPRVLSVCRSDLGADAPQHRHHGNDNLRLRARVPGSDALDEGS